MIPNIVNLVRWLSLMTRPDDPSWPPRRRGALEPATVLEIQALALELGLAEPARRTMLIDDPRLEARLTRSGLDAAAQQLGDLRALNAMRDAQGEPAQLEHWLRTAAALTAPDPRADRFRQWGARLGRVERTGRGRW